VAPNSLKVKAESPMKLAPMRPRAFALWLAWFTLAFGSAHAGAQSCQTSTELEDATRTAITSAGQRFFDMASKGDAASMRQNAVPNLASDFAGIEATVKDHQQDLSGAQASVKTVYLLDATGAEPAQQAEFLCGVFGKNGQNAGSAAFYLNDLAPGKYSVVLLDATSSRGKTMFSEILMQVGTDWKLAGLYVKSGQVAGHDSDWFLDHARQYKAKGQSHNAWLFYVQTIDLVSRGMRFMSSLATDKLYDEAQSVQPTDLPVAGKTVDLAAGTTTYKVSAVYPWTIGSDLELFVKYHVADVSNSNQSYQDNVAVIKALVTKFPELRDAFAGVEAIAIDNSGRDYGTLLAMKDIK